eukprot:449025_1
MSIIDVNNLLLAITNIISWSVCNNFGPGIYGNAGPQYIDGNNALVYYNADTGQVTTLSTPNNNYPTLPMQSTIDQNNNIYYFLTDINTETNISNTYLIPFNLTDPTNKIDPIELQSCFADTNVDIGEQYISNPLRGNISLLCHSVTNPNNESDLFMLSWNINRNTLDSRLIQSYEVGNSMIMDISVPTIFDSKRNRLWAIQGYETSTQNGAYINNFDVLNGTIYKQILFREWTLETGVYSYNIDKIVSVLFTTTIKSDNTFFYNINVTLADPVSAGVIENIGSVNISYRNYCKQSFIYTMDIDNGIWYQLMYRNADNSPCLRQNDSDIFIGDLLTIDIQTATLKNVVSVCNYTENHNEPDNITCPWSIEYWNPN